MVLVLGEMGVGLDLAGVGVRTGSRGDVGEGFVMVKRFLGVGLEVIEATLLFKADVLLLMVVVVVVVELWVFEIEGRASELLLACFAEWLFCT